MNRQVRVELGGVRITSTHASEEFTIGVVADVYKGVLI